MLDSLSESPQAISQRELARRAGLSVGLINAVMRRLVKTGYVKTSRLNRRSIQYLLTPRGFVEKALKSYRYLLQTVQSYQAMQQNCSTLLTRLREEGFSTFHLHGDGEMAELLVAFLKAGDYGRVRYGLPVTPGRRIVVLNVAPVPVKAPGVRVVDVLRELAERRI